MRLLEEQAARVHALERRVAELERSIDEFVDRFEAYRVEQSDRHDHLQEQIDQPDRRQRR